MRDVHFHFFSTNIRLTRSDRKCGFPTEEQRDGLQGCFHTNPLATLIDLVNPSVLPDRAGGK